MSNILKGIVNVVNNYSRFIESSTTGGSRMNDMGAGLEVYIRNAFAETFDLEKADLIKKQAKVFSHKGTTNKSPDLMFRGGDAIEIKKQESGKSDLQLNSSYPKDKLRSNDSRVSDECKECENWTERDIIYAVGHVPKKTKTLKSLWFVYGDCYAALPSTYSDIANLITEAIDEIPSLDIKDDTNELSGVRNVDPLEITYLRVRGMWTIKHPSIVFDYVINQEKNSSFQLFAIMREAKYLSFNECNRKEIEDHKQIDVSDIEIQDPNQPMKLIKAKLITFKGN